MWSKYRTLDELVEKRLPHLQPELPETNALFKKMKAAKKSGSFSKNTLKEMWLWKNECSRFVDYIYEYYDGNSEEKVREVSRQFFAAQNDTDRMKSLLNLSGIKTPTASAVLMFYDPNEYGVVDIHVWRTFHHYKSVNTKADGKNLSLDNWLQAIGILRKLCAKFSAKDPSITTRKIEKVIFEYGQMQARKR